MVPEQGDSEADQRPEQGVTTLMLQDLSYTCVRCGSVSFNPSDRIHRYCARCKRFEDDKMRDASWALESIRESYIRTLFKLAPEEALQREEIRKLLVELADAHVDTRLGRLLRSAIFALETKP